MKTLLLGIGFIFLVLFAGLFLLPEDAFEIKPLLNYSCEEIKQALLEGNHLTHTQLKDFSTDLYHSCYTTKEMRDHYELRCK